MFELDDRSAHRWCARPLDDDFHVQVQDVGIVTLWLRKTEARLLVCIAEFDLAADS